MSDTGKASKRAAFIWAVLFTILFNAVILAGNDGGLNSAKMGLIVGLSLIAIPLGMAGYAIGNKIRMAVHPDIVITRNGLFGLAFQKVFWKVGPQFLGCLGTVFFTWGAIFLLVGNSNIGEAAQARAMMQKQEQVAQAQAAAKEEQAKQAEEQKKQEQLTFAKMNVERDAFIRKYISDFDTESFVEIEASKLDTYLRRNEGNVPKRIKILGYNDSVSSLNAYIKTYGIEMVDITDASGFINYIPDAKLVITRQNRNFIRSNEHLNLEVLVIDTGITSISFYEVGGGINWSEYPKLRAVYLPPTIVEKLSMVYSPKIDFFISPDVKPTYYWVEAYTNESIQIPDSVQELYIVRSPNLKNIQISPNSRLSRINFSATGITSIYLPATIKEIVGVPNSLKSVTIAAKTPPNLLDMFPKTIEKIYVPAESLKVYEEKWYDYEFTFKNQLTAIE